MAMDRAAFDALIARMEALAVTDPAAYRRRVMALAILGYGFLALVMLMLATLCAFFIASVVYLKALAVKLLILSGTPLLLGLCALRMRTETPAGQRLTRQMAPDLFQMLDDLRRRLATPPLHAVLLTPEFNAGVMQAPRFGLFGRHRSYLFIGLPLMKSLTVEQFQSVLAHELGHLSHARSGNWIYRLRPIWQRLESAVSRIPQWGATPLHAFFRWYMPRFSATSFPLARANEYEADAAAIELTSARSAAQALTAVSIVGSYLSEKYWPRIHSAARELPQPAFAPYSEFIATAIQDVPAAELRSWQQTALAAKTACGDTHPSLADRLAAMGAQAEFAPPSAVDSAERLLGAERTRLQSAFDAQWRERVAKSWQQVHENTRANRLRIAQLRCEASWGELDERKALELANLEEDVGDGPVAALAMRRCLLARFPDSVPLRFSLARQLLQADDPEGVRSMEALIETESGAVLLGAEALRDYYWRRDEMPLATQWHQRFLECAARRQAVQRERSQLLLSDTVVGHQLPAQAVAALAAQLRSVSQVRRAYLVRKLTLHAAQIPLYVLGFRRTAWWALSNEARANAALQQIRQAVVFPRETLIVSLENSGPQLESMLRRVGGSRIL